MIDIALATCARLPDLDSDDRPLLAALEARGLAAAAWVWDDPAVEWGQARSVVVRSTWDYEARRAEFLGWAARVEALGVSLWNRARTLEWNTHKGYLLEMEAAGIPIVPSRLLRPGDEAALDEALARWDDPVVKPAVGAGARGALRAGHEAATAHARALLRAGEAALLQPYRGAVASQGELSLLFFGGEYSHAVLKKPRSGEWRVQETWGGTREPATAPRAARELADRVLAWVKEPLLYARVDLLPGPGGWELSELEATEPSLYLAQGGPQALARLTDAIAQRITPR